MDNPTRNDERLEPASAICRRGAVAVIVREGRCLLIRRAEGIEAAGAYCFPGGGIEPGETETEALCRELREELGVMVEPRERLWENVTPWGVHLAWWLAEVDLAAKFDPNPAEVADVLWTSWLEMRGLRGLLASNLAFLDALERGEFVIG